MFNDDIEIMPRPIAALFWALYIGLLALLLYVFGRLNTNPAFAITSWAFCLPPYVLLFSMAYERLRRK